MIYLIHSLVMWTRTLHFFPRRLLILLFIAQCCIHFTREHGLRARQPFIPARYRRAFLLVWINAWNHWFIVCVRWLCHADVGLVLDHRVGPNAGRAGETDPVHHRVLAAATWRVRWTLTQTTDIVQPYVWNAAHCPYMVSTSMYGCPLPIQFKYSKFMYGCPLPIPD